MWPLNPEGEIFLAFKIENKRSLMNTEELTKIPGIGFIEWAPLDMSLSLGVLGGNLPPYPPVMEESRRRVVAATKDPRRLRRPGEQGQRGRIHR